MLGGDGKTNTLTGAEGRDYIQSFGDDDISHIDSASDVIIENAGEGTDTIEIDAAYNSGTYTIAANI